MIYDTIRYDIFVDCNWVDTQWQQYSTHLHTNSTQNNTMKQNTQNGTCTSIRILKLTKEHIIYKLNRGTQNTQPYIQ